ncbi:hypothetical protein GQ457_09G020720 [Hibiscus cannabinus]
MGDETKAPKGWELQTVHLKEMFERLERQCSEDPNYLNKVLRRLSGNGELESLRIEREAVMKEQLESTIQVFDEMLVPNYEVKEVGSSATKVFDESSLKTDNEFVRPTILISEKNVDEGNKSKSEEMIVQEVDKKLLEEPEVMSFPTSRATCAPHFSGTVLLAFNFHSKQNDNIDVEIAETGERSYAIDNSLLIDKSYSPDSHYALTQALVNYTIIPLVSPPVPNRIFKVQPTKDYDFRGPGIHSKPSNYLDGHFVQLLLLKIGVPTEVLRPILQYEIELPFAIVSVNYVGIDESLLSQKIGNGKPPKVKIARSNDVCEKVTTMKQEVRPTKAPNLAKVDKFRKELLVDILLALCWYEISYKIMSSTYSLNRLLLLSSFFDPWGQGSFEGRRNVITVREANNGGNKDGARVKEHVEVKFKDPNLVEIKSDNKKEAAIGVYGALLRRANAMLQQTIGTLQLHNSSRIHCQEKMASINQIHKLLKGQLEKAQQRMKQYAIRNAKTEKLQEDKSTSCFSHTTVDKKLELPENCRIHKVFQVSLHKKRVGDNVIHSIEPPELSGDEQLKVYSVIVLDKPMVKRSNKTVTQLLVQWSKLRMKKATWENYTVEDSISKFRFLRTRINCSRRYCHDPKWTLGDKKELRDAELIGEDIEGIIVIVIALQLSCYYLLVQIICKEN